MSLFGNVCCKRNYLRKYIRFNAIIGKYCSSVTSTNDNYQQISRPITIKIPKRIERGPTDILRALANTIQKDYTAPQYRYNDDPFLTPIGSYHKRLYAFSKDSGKRAARYFFDEYPELFYRDDAEPKIEAFSYPDMFDENTIVDETDLKKCIIRSEVSNAIIVYNNLKRDNVKISSETLQELLELTCFYNNEDPLSDEYLNEKWFSNYMSDSRKNWKEHAFAEQLFNSIEEKTSETYCAIIMGMAKYNHAEKAYNFYQIMREKNLRCNVETYNALIRVVSYLRDSYDPRWQLIEEFLRSMSDDQLMPNLGTLNAVLEQLSKTSLWKLSRMYGKRTIVEMVKNLGITPSLATYKYLLNIFCQERGKANELLYEIMDDIDDQEFEPKDVKDVLFFGTAMDIACNFVGDIQLAYRIHNLLSKGNNDKFISLFIHENLYYNNLFQLLCFAENVDKLMEFYDKYVPNIHAPNPELCINLIENIELNDAFHYILKIWNDIKLYDVYSDQNLFNKLVKVLSKTKFIDELQQPFVNIATVVLERGVEMARKNKPNFDLTGVALSNFIIIFLNGGKLDEAYEVIRILDKEQHRIVGYPESEAITMFCKFAIDAKEYEYALYAIRYCNSCDMPDVAKSALNYCETINLDQKFKSDFERMTALNLIKEKINSVSSQTVGHYNSSVEENSESKTEDLD